MLPPRLSLLALWMTAATACRIVPSDETDGVTPPQTEPDPIPWCESVYPGIDEEFVLEREDGTWVRVPALAVPSAAYYCIEDGVGALPGPEWGPVYSPAVRFTGTTQTFSPQYTFRIPFDGDADRAAVLVGDGSGGWRVPEDMGAYPVDLDEGGMAMFAPYHLFGQFVVVGLPPVAEQSEAIQGPTDLLLVVDDGPGMAPLQQQLRAQLDWESLREDVRVGVIRADVTEGGGLRVLPGGARWLDDPGAATDAEIDALVLLGETGGAPSTGLQALESALSEPTLSGTNSGFLRAEAQLTVLLLTNRDDAGSAPPSQTQAVFASAKPAYFQFRSLLIAGDPGGCTGTNGSAADAMRYRQALAGEALSACDPSWLAALDDFGQASLRGRRHHLALADTPDLSAPIRGTATGVGVLPLEEDLGYDPDRNAAYFAAPLGPEFDTLFVQYTSVTP